MNQRTEPEDGWLIREDAVILKVFKVLEVG